MAILTRSDWDQFRKVVREEVEAEVKATEHNLRSQISRTQDEIREVKDRVKTTEILSRGMEKRMGLVSSKVTQNTKQLDILLKGQTAIKRELKKSIIHLDNHFTRRINRLEEQAKLPPLGQN